MEPSGKAQNSEPDMISIAMSKMGDEAEGGWRSVLGRLPAPSFARLGNDRRARAGANYLGQASEDLRRFNSVVLSSRTHERLLF